MKMEYLKNNTPFFNDKPLEYIYIYIDRIK